jgi:hypothetical protein
MGVCPVRWRRSAPWTDCLALAVAVESLREGGNHRHDSPAPFGFRLVDLATPDGSLNVNRAERISECGAYRSEKEVTYV